MTTTLNESGVRKAAILLVQLGQEQAAQLLAMLPEAEVEAISAEIASTSASGSIARSWAACSWPSWTRRMAALRTPDSFRVVVMSAVRLYEPAAQQLRDLFGLALHHRGDLVAGGHPELVGGRAGQLGGRRARR